MKKALLALSLLVSPLAIHATECQDLSGTYRISGNDPFLQTPYTGIAVITKHGEIYRMNSTFIDTNTGAETFAISTGYVDDDKVIFAIEDLLDAPSFGAASYHIHKTKLVGKWTYLGQTMVGTEKLKPICE